MTRHLKPTRYLARKHRIPMLFTQRLELIEATLETLRAALRCHPERSEGSAPQPPLADLLHARVPPTWPPELLDAQALEWTIRHLEDPATRGSVNMYFVVLRDGAHARTLVGVCGYHTPSEGTLQVGYGVVAEYQRRGIATEATRALVSDLAKRAGVHRVIAETYPDHVASLGVMRRCGFRFVGPGSEAGTVQYELARQTS